MSPLTRVSSQEYVQSARASRFVLEVELEGKSINKDLVGAAGTMAKIIVENKPTNVLSDPIHVAACSTHGRRMLSNNVLKLNNDIFVDMT